MGSIPAGQASHGGLSDMGLPLGALVPDALPGTKSIRACRLGHQVNGVHPRATAEEGSEPLIPCNIEEEYAIQVV